MPPLTLMPVTNFCRAVKLSQKAGLLLPPPTARTARPGNNVPARPRRTNARTLMALTLIPDRVSEHHPSGGMHQQPRQIFVANSFRAVFRTSVHRRCRSCGTEFADHVRMPPTASPAPRGGRRGTLL